MRSRLQRAIAAVPNPEWVVTSPDGVLAGLGTEQPVWMSHGDSITRLPAGFHATAQTHATPYAGLAEAYAVLALYDVVPPPAALVRGLTAAERAVALGP